MTPTPSANPKTIRQLPGGVPLREPWPEERRFFKSRADVSGMAADDNAVVLNPHTTLSPQEKDAVPDDPQQVKALKAVEKRARLVARMKAKKSPQ